MLKLLITLSLVVLAAPGGLFSNVHEYDYASDLFYTSVGFSDANKHDHDVIKAAKQAVKSISEKHENFKNWFKLTKINEPEKKTEDGKNSYRLKIICQETNCLKSKVDYKHIDDCDLQKKGMKLYCKVIESKYSNGTYNLEYSDCANGQA